MSVVGVSEGFRWGRGLAMIFLAGLVAAVSMVSSRWTSDDTTHPPATDDEGGAFEAIQEMLNQVDVVWERLAGDPSAVDSPGQGDIERYEHLHTPDSPALDSSIEWLEDLAGDGHAQRAPSGRPYQQTLMIAPRVVAADTVEFYLCRTLEAEVVNPGEAAGGTGEVDIVRENEGALVVAGEGEARRIDGRWRLHRFKGQKSMLLGKEGFEPVEWYSTTIDVECEPDAFDW